MTRQAVGHCFEDDDPRLSGSAADRTSAAVRSDAETEVKNWVGAIVYNGALQRLRIYGIASLGSAIYVEYASKDMKYLSEDSFLEKNKRRHHD